VSDLSVRQIKTMLQLRAGELARRLAPGGHVSGGLYVAPNPTRNDRHATSFKIHVSGPKAGGWTDYAGVNAAFGAGGDRGDIIQLIAYVETNRDQKAAIRWAKDWLGLASVSQDDRRRWAERAQAISQEQDAREAEEARRKTERVLRLFMAATPGLAGPAATYLAGRAIDLAAIAGLNTTDLRLHPHLEHWRSSHVDRRGVRMPGPTLPTIVCGIRKAGGAITAVHCTFLAPDGSTKADVAAAKLMYGDVTGGVIRVSHGPTRTSPEQWADAGVPPSPLIVCEGLEDALTLAEAAPEARVWAATSLGNLGNVPVDHPCISEVIVAGDNDWGKGQAMAQFDRAIAALEARGKPLTIMRSIAGKDFNDLARSGSAPQHRSQDHATNP
jgi:hypothetical protein